MDKTIISLFDFTGAWPRPYWNAGYHIVPVDIKNGKDILTWDYKSYFYGKSVYGILAAPPCTDYSVSGAQYWPVKDKDGRTAQSNMLINKTLEIVNYFYDDLEFWSMENPIGRLRRMLHGEYKEGEPHLIIPERLKPVDVLLAFNPCDYGDAYTKKTLLWGKFNPMLVQTPVKPIRYNKQGSWIQSLGGKSERTKELRSATPKGFSQAFYNANK